MPLIEIRTVIPLWHFEPATELPVVLDSQLSIRKLDGVELGAIEEHLGIYGTIVPEYGIEFRRQEERPIFPSEKLGHSYAAAVRKWLSLVDIDAGFNYGKKVIEAMRLFASGDIGTTFYINLFPNGGIETGNPLELSSSYLGSVYNSLRYPPVFATFLANYMAWNIKDIARHLTRFLKAYQHNSWYDRLIDFVTSIEGGIGPPWSDSRTSLPVVAARSTPARL